MGIHVYNTHIFRQACDSNKSVQIGLKFQVHSEREGGGGTEKDRETATETVFIKTKAPSEGMYAQHVVIQAKRTHSSNY